MTAKPKNTYKLHIQSQRPITIMFIDMEGASDYWAAKGDTNGRLMVDRFNRLVIPLIKRYNGKIIKKLGDALMASFKKPKNAVNAAIAIQQAITRERETNKTMPKVKIGIHTGAAHVEKDDVHGDMVNVAKRLEDRCRGGEILLSTRLARKMKPREYYLKRGDRFLPKGQTKEITAYTCQWEQAPDKIENFDLTTKLIITPTQKWEILLSTLGSIAALFALYLTYIRYFLADNNLIALFVLDPLHIIISQPWTAIFPLGIIGFGLYFLLRLKKLPFLFFKIAAGGFGFLIAFYFFLIPASLNLFDGIDGETIKFESKNRFVKTVTAKTTIHEEPTTNSPEIRSVLNNTLLLQNDVRKNSKQGDWFRVLIAKKRYGWIKRNEPMKMGVPEKIFSVDYKFQFRYKDIYRLIFSLIGFIIGLLCFRLKPV